MEILDHDLLNLWKNLNEFKVKYIMVGGFATNLHGFSRTTADCDIWIEDSPANRKNLRSALEKTEGDSFDYIERMDFVPGWTSIKLSSGLDLDIMTYLKGFPTESFEKCFNESSTALIYGLSIPFLHINHLIEAKRQAGRPKDLIDIIELEKIKEQRDASQG
ncbi:MAG: hypothetical protein JWM14_2378 [Chitinophagaceae bacterium]|nr:hypothetical protein [Chitinophagaceae bacterium]